MKISYYMALEFKEDNLLYSEYVLLVARMHARMNHAVKYAKSKC